MRVQDERLFRHATQKTLSKLEEIRKAIRTGNPVLVDNILSSPEYRHEVERIFFNDLPFAIDSFEYIWAQASYVAIEAGVDALEVGRIYEHYRSQLIHAKSVAEILQYNQQFHFSAASLVHAISQETKYSPVIRVCRAYIREHIREGLTVQDVADALGYSRGYLSNLFKKETGQTIYSFIQSLKLAETIELISDPKVPTSQVWALMGFCSQSHFSEFFKKQTGKSPKQFEKEILDNQKQALPALSGEANPKKGASSSLLEDPGNESILEQLLDYAEDTGFKQQLYYLYCVQKGRVSELQKELSDSHSRKQFSGLFQSSRDIAFSALTYLVPQISSAAVNGGASMRQASDLYVKILDRAGKSDAAEILDLLDEAFLEYAKLVQKAKQQPE